MQKAIHSLPSRILCSLLRQLRREAGLTQEQLGQRLQLASQTISAIERGERMVNVVELREYLAALDWSLPAFIAMYEESLAAGI